ncbi:hypothetical protein ACJJTC_003244 [Scirpophaga incertulas]
MAGEACACAPTPPPRLLPDPEPDHLYDHHSSEEELEKTKLRAKHLGWRKQEETPIFVSEHLTGKAARLYFLARDLAKNKLYKFCWTSLGRVYVRKNEEKDSPYIQITSEHQIQDLLKND